MMEYAFVRQLANPDLAARYLADAYIAPVF